MRKGAVKPHKLCNQSVARIWKQNTAAKKALQIRLRERVVLNIFRKHENVEHNTRLFLVEHTNKLDAQVEHSTEIDSPMAKSRESVCSGLIYAWEVNSRNTQRFEFAITHTDIVKWALSQYLATL